MLLAIRLPLCRHEERQSWPGAMPWLALPHLKEQTNVVGVPFFYTTEDIPQGLCQGKRLFYVSTTGGDFGPMEYSFEYVKSLAQNFPFLSP